MTKINTSDYTRLIGVWKTSGKISTENGTLDLNGTDTYELILDGNYMLHKADVMMGAEKSETFEMISMTDTTNKATMQYFNSKGETGLMTSEINNNEFSIKGDGIKFSGTINDENTELTGKWFLKTDEGWAEFIDLKLEKQT